jgi:enoyl-CoA hydratase/carnithine racemase
MSIDFELREDGIAIITMNRPEQLNALDHDHYEALSNAWKRVRDDKDVVCAIVTGAGERSFTTGADIKNVLTNPDELSDMWMTQRDQLLNRGLEVWKPIIAAINGYCLGGGMTLLFSTDIRIAADHATFGLSEVKRGIVPANGGTQRVLSQLPYAIGMELLLTGDRWDAETAAKWGLINKVVAKEDLMATALDYAERIAANGPLALQAAKELAIRARDMDITTGLRMEQLSQRLLKFTEDAAEGPAAFKEKRTPNFNGK